MKIYPIKTTLPFVEVAPQAARDLSPNAFILWCAFYIESQTQSFFEITPQALTQQWGIARTTYYRMLTELQEKGYLDPDQNGYTFYESPVG